MKAGPEPVNRLADPRGGSPCPLSRRSQAPTLLSRSIRREKLTRHPLPAHERDLGGTAADDRTRRGQPTRHQGENIQRHRESVPCHQAAARQSFRRSPDPREGKAAPRRLNPRQERHPHGKAAMERHFRATFSGVLIALPSINPSLSGVSWGWFWVWVVSSAGFRHSFSAANPSPAVLCPSQRATERVQLSL